MIQLVLKTKSGHWMPFRFVQMVMIHELSHCKEMNHSKEFWKVKNGYASELEVLWSQGYTGEGMWSRGINLTDGQISRTCLEVDEPLPEHLCGGTYHSGGRRRRSAQKKMSHKERQAKRIAKKFGSNGQPLGADGEIKLKLERGKHQTAKPRVAGSVRGRELRAAAALARFEVRKDKPESENSDCRSGSESESDVEWNMTIKTDPNEAVDINGKKLMDGEGKGLFKVYEDDDKLDTDVQNEMSQLRDIIQHGRSPATQSRATSKVRRRELAMDSTLLSEPSFINGAACPICSMENYLGSSTCAACANVLVRSKLTNAWSCNSELCRDGSYLNAGDCGICGLCGARKSSSGS